MTRYSSVTFWDVIEEAGIPKPKTYPSQSRFLRWGKNGRYYAKDIGDGIIYGDWKEGINKFYPHSCSNKPSKHQTKERQTKFLEQIDKDAKERNNINLITSKKAEYIFNKSKIVLSEDEHKYLLDKNINQNGTRILNKELIIPLYSIDKKLWSIQFISEDGNKRFLKNGRKKGCFYPLGQVADYIPLIICEGFATGCTLHELTNYSVICALDAGNLYEVTKVIRSKYPNNQIIIAADNDCYGNRNIGIETAMAVAKKFNCKVIYPTFGRGGINHAE